MNRSQRFQFYKLLGKETNIEYNTPLAKFTTWKTGGPAEALIRLKSEKDFVQVFSLLEKEPIPYFILGGGSNLLIADLGFKGLVIKNEFSGIKVLGSKNKLDENNISKTVREQKTVNIKTLDFNSLDYNDSTKQKIILKVNSGENLHKTIFNSIDLGATGLQWFAGIPGTVGGATFQNIHGGTRNLDTYISEVEIFLNGRIKTLTHKDLNFKYGYSNLMESKFPIVSTTFELNTHNKNLAKQTAVNWIKQKVLQPKNSGGCVFTNLSKYQAKKANLPTTSVGYLIDQVLNLRGYKIGGVQIAPTHANFIQNNGGGNAQEVAELIKMVKSKAFLETGLKIKEEINYIGQFN